MQYWIGVVSPGFAGDKDFGLGEPRYTSASALKGLQRYASAV